MKSLSMRALIFHYRLPIGIQLLRKISKMFVMSTESYKYYCTLLKSLLMSAVIFHYRLPIGIQLLRKMGWKEGQGIGPRVKKKSKKKRGRTRILA